MTFLFQSKIAEVQSQLPVVPKTPQIQTFKLTDEEKKATFSSLTYLVTGNHVQVSEKRGKGKRKMHFPSPVEAAKLTKVYQVVKTFERTQIVSTATIPTQGAYSFDYNSINDSGSLSAVFDQYRIAMLEVTFLPDYNVAGAGTSVVPMFHTAVDLDDNTSVSALQLMDYPGCVSTTSLKQHKHVFVPHCALAAYSGAFTSYANVEAPWIDVASPAVYHFGVKYAFEAAPAVAGYEVRVRMLLQLKNFR